MAIIAILIFITLASVSSIRNHALLANCANNLRNIGVGMSLYATDHNNFYPASWGNPNGTWCQELATDTYVSDTSVFRCPGDTTPMPVIVPGSGNFSSSYTYCSPVMTGNSYNLLTPLNRMTIEQPTRQYLITEWHAGGVVAGWDLSQTSVSPTHINGGRNFLFADGHVEFRTMTAVNDPSSGWVLNSIASPY